MRSPASPLAPLPLRALALLLAFGLAGAGLSGCSGSDGDDDDDATLAGSWELQSVTERSFLTLSSSQTIRRPDQPGTGGLVLTGDATGTLRYFVGDPATGNAFASDQSLFGAELTQLIRFTSAAPPNNVQLDMAPDRSLDVVSYDGAAPFTRAATYVEANNVLFRDPDDPTFEVTVTGRLTVATQQLTANQEATLTSSTTARADASILTRTFGDGAVYTQRNGDLTTETGTWADLGGGQVRTVLGGTTTTYDYAISGSTLTLESGGVTACDAECQLTLSVYYGVDDGTLASLRNEDVETLTRGAAEPARPAPTAAR